VYKFAKGNTTTSVTFNQDCSIDLLLVGGGGAGFYYNNIINKRYGYGGAGGFYQHLNYPVKANVTYTITVGGHGISKYSSGQSWGGNGGTSAFSSTDISLNITATGGGGGNTNPTDGSCGGSGSYIYNTISGVGKSNDKGISTADTNDSTIKIGSNTSNTTKRGGGAGGPDGTGLKSDITGESYTYAFGGGFTGTQNTNYGSGNGGSTITSNNNGVQGVVLFRINQPVTTSPTKPSTRKPSTTRPSTTKPSTTTLLKKPSTTKPSTTQSKIHIKIPHIQNNYIPYIPNNQYITNVPNQPNIPNVPNQPNIPNVPNQPNIPNIQSNHYTQNNNHMQYMQYMPYIPYNPPTTKPPTTKAPTTKAPTTKPPTTKSPTTKPVKDTYRTRMIEYIKIISVLLSVFILVWSIHLLNMNNILPKGAFEFLTILIISIACIGEYILIVGIENVYTGIISRY